MKVQEGDVVLELKKGNVQAFDVLYNKYSRSVYAMAYSHLKNEQESEGVVQNTFMYIWNNRHRIKLELSFKSYIFTITSNNIKKIFRSEKYSTQLKGKYDYKQENVQPDDELEYNLLLEKIDKLIDELPERRRLIFLKSRKEGLNSKEIAKELGITPGAVDNQISQAIKFLRAHLREITIILIIIL
jgi:RNA polymerase sigma-70 factor (ECF subfamily)